VRLHPRHHRRHHRHCHHRRRRRRRRRRCHCPSGFQASGLKDTGHTRLQGPREDRLPESGVRALHLHGARRIIRSIVSRASLRAGAIGSEGPPTSCSSLRGSHPRTLATLSLSLSFSLSLSVSLCLSLSVCLSLSLALSLCPFLSYRDSAERPVDPRARLSYRERRRVEGASREGDMVVE